MRSVSQLYESAASKLRSDTREVHVWRCVGAIAILLLMSGAVRADNSCLPTDNPIQQAFGDCGNPCRIRSSMGGPVSIFRAAAEAVHKTRMRVIIDGVCPSGCPLFADWARPYVCITPNAVFLFHMARRYSQDDLTCTRSGTLEVHVRENARIEEYNEPPHSQDIKDWAKPYGGFPIFNILPMYVSEAQRFWPLCGPDILSKTR